MISEIHSDNVLRRFEEDIIDKHDDTKSSDWLRLSQQLEEVILMKQGFEINLLSPKGCIATAIDQDLTKKFGSFEKYLDQLDNAFYSLSLFALNLCRQPNRRDYQLIKTYNGFYVYNIGSVMNGEDISILQSMGYVISTQENADEFTLQKVNQNITMLAFQLYLAQLYCRRIKTIVLTITSSNYPDKVAMHLYQYFDKPDFKMEQIINLCELTRTNMEKNDAKKQQQSAYLREHRSASEPVRYEGLRSMEKHAFHIHPNPSVSSVSGRASSQPIVKSLVNDDVEDTDLYGDESTEQLYQPRSSDESTKPADTYSPRRRSEQIPHLYTEQTGQSYGQRPNHNSLTNSSEIKYPPSYNNSSHFQGSSDTGLMRDSMSASNFEKPDDGYHQTPYPPYSTVQRMDYPHGNPQLPPANHSFIDSRTQTSTTRDEKYNTGLKSHPAYSAK